MKRKKLPKFLCLLLAAVFSFPLLTVDAMAEGEAPPISVYTVEDLMKLAQNCTLDSWSQGKTVFLEADLDLTGKDFIPIPTFGGTFEGQGHTISGLSITGSGNARGLFRYIQPSGTVRNLSVKGNVIPSGRKDVLGGLAGNNRGVVVNCTFHGNVSGADSIGGLVGINEAEGQIVNGFFSGSVTGEHYVGGIAGQNFGAVIECENNGSINTTEVDAQLELDQLNQEQLNAAENIPACTDIGGIAGFSTGILQNCTNTAPVGYAHVGYNIGGIVGRQSGYLDGCVNSGAVLGRKDVGGIAGQLEPEVRLLYNEREMDRLLDELDVLQNLLSQAQNGLQASSAEFSRQLQVISDRAGEATEVLDGLMNSVTGWTGENIGEINHLSTRISWLIRELSPILEKTADGMDQMESLADELSALLDQAQEAGEIGTGAAEEAQKAVRNFKAAVSHGKNALTHLQSALEHLRDGLGQSAYNQEVLNEIENTVSEFFSNLTDIVSAIVRIPAVFQETGDAWQETEEGDALMQAMAELQTAGAAAASYPVRMGEALIAVVKTEAQNSEALEQLKAAGNEMCAAMQAFSHAVQDNAAALRQLWKLLEQGGDGLTELRNAGDTMEEIAVFLSCFGEEVSDIFQEFSAQPAITIHPIDQEIQKQSELVGDIFSGLLEDGNILRESMTNSTDALLDDMEAIGNQFGVITDLLRHMPEASGEETEERFEDISDRESGLPDTGVIASARNTGEVQGDINVSGITGSMAIEYDFDPEDDLVEEGSRSLDFRYQTSAVIDSCVNTGRITGKQDYAGGVAGRMDLGRISSCENYGDIASTDGDYVGGIAGASWGSIRDSWSRCSLSGGDYIGGVAGQGATILHCHTLVRIGEGKACLGSVAGNVNNGGMVSGNTFTGDMGALDGISYAGQAEPVDFDTLCTAAPEAFSQLELTFVANGIMVAVIPFRYGEGVETLPDIPAKEGYSASWPDIDYTCLTASQTLEAEYTPHTSALTDGGALPQILVDGNFSSEATVTHTAEEVSWMDENQRQYSGTAFTVTVKDPSAEQMSYTVHYRMPEPGKRYVLWVYSENGWMRQEYEADGQYLLLNSQASEIIFCVTEQPETAVVWAMGGIAGAVFLIAAFFFRRYIRKKNMH